MTFSPPCHPARVLTASGREGEIVRHVHRREHLLLLGAQVLSREADRLFHRGESQQLQQVVLDHVTGRTDAVVVTRASADADVLGHGDLHVVDVVAVPDRLVQLVREAQRQDVLDRLLAEVVVDAEDRVGREGHLESGIERPRRLEVMAEGLLDHDATPALVVVTVLADETGLLELLATSGKSSAGSTGRTRGCPSSPVRRRASRWSRGACGRSPDCRTRPRRSGCPAAAGSRSPRGTACARAP